MCLSYQSIFLPEGELYEPYILSRNLLIISILNWTFLLGLYLIYEEDKKKNINQVKSQSHISSEQPLQIEVLIQ